MNRTPATLLLCLLLSACGESANAPQTSAPEDPTREARTLIDRAATAARRAQELGHAWTGTETHLAAARAALAEGDAGSAMTQAQQALALAEGGIDQAEREAQAWTRRFPGS